MDVVTAYFNIHGYNLLKEGLSGLGSFRLLLGEEPTSGERIGLKPDTTKLNLSVRTDLENEPFNEETLKLVEDLIRFLRHENVELKRHAKGFLHAKCFLFYSEKINEMREKYGMTSPATTSTERLELAREDLKLICFDFLCS
jgi:hypothetical protein